MFKVFWKFHFLKPGTLRSYDGEAANEETAIKFCEQCGYSYAYGEWATYPELES